MNAKRTEPSVSLLQGKKYTPAANTNLAAQWRQFFDYQRKAPNAQDYAQDEMDSARSQQQ